jgi:membrane-associated progesterone receptor component
MAEESVETNMEENTSFLGSLYKELVDSPLNLCLVFVIAFLIYKIFKSKNQVPHSSPPEPELPKLRRDFTVQELKQFDGKQEDGRVLVAVNGTVYDCTKGKKFYGPGNFFFLFFFAL